MDHGGEMMTDEEMAEMPHDDSDGHHEENADDQEADHDDDEEAHEDEGDAVEDDHEAEAGHEEEGHDAEEGHAVEDAVLVLGPGETGTLVFTFPENDHDFTAAVCLIPGHYEAGMATDLQYSA
jgi:zinc transport system substrate-binding protein